MNLCAMGWDGLGYAVRLSQPLLVQQHLSSGARESGPADSAARSAGEWAAQLAPQRDFLREWRCSKRGPGRVGYQSPVVTARRGPVIERADGGRSRDAAGFQALAVRQLAAF